MTTGRPPPDLVVLDLRLPWGEESALQASAISGGIGCLELLRQEPATKNLTVIIYSAFLDDERIKEALSGHGPLIIVDKIDQGRLKTKLENLVSDRRSPYFFRTRRFAKATESTVLRLGAIATAVIAIIAVLVWLIHHFLG